MSRKPAIAILAAALIALAAAPAGASATELCAPGTPTGPYCTKSTGITLRQHLAFATHKDSRVEVSVHCRLKSGCLGTLLLEGRGKGHSRPHHHSHKGKVAGAGHHRAHGASHRHRGHSAHKRRGHSARRHKGHSAHGHRGHSAHRHKGHSGHGHKGHSAHKGTSHRGGPILYGKALYTLDGGQTAKLSFHLRRAARRILRRRGELTVVVIAHSKGFSETIGTLHIKAHRPGHKHHHHKGHVQTAPEGTVDPV